MSRYVLWIACLLLVLGGARADGEEEVVWRDLPTAAGQSRAAMEAFEAGETDRLATLASRYAVDPWLVAEDLLLRGRAEAAMAFARAAQAANGKDVETLPGYLQGRGAQPDDERQRAALRSLTATDARPGLDEQLELTSSARSGQDTVVSLELRRLRARALTARNRRAEGQQLLRGVADAAKRLGWWRGAIAALHELADSARAVRDLPTDEAALEEMATIAQTRGRPQAEAEALHTRALFLKDAKQDVRGAIALQERELAIWQELGEGSRSAAALINLGIAYMGAGASDRSIAYLERGLAAAREIGHRPWAANALLSMGVLYMRRNQLDKALDLYEQALVLQKAGNEHGGVGAAYGNIAIIHQRRRDLPKAMEASRKAAEAYEQAGRPDRAAGIHESLGTLLAMRGEHAEALGVLERAIQQGETARDAELVARCQARRATSLSMLGRQEEALTEIEHSISGFEALALQGWLDAARSLRGHILNEFQRHEEALELLESVRARQEARGETETLAQTLGRIGTTHGLLGDVEHAAELLQKAVEAARSIGDANTEVTATTNLAGLLAQLGRLDQALETYDRAIQLAGALGRVGVLRDARVGKAGVFLTQGKRKEALQIYRLMLGEARRAKDPIREAAVLGHMANLQMLAGQPAKALTTLARARELFEAAGRPAAVAATDCTIGLAHHQLGRFAKALSTLEDARDRSRELGNEVTVARAEGAIANVYEYLGDSDKALESHERSLAAHTRRGDRLEIARATIHLGNAFSSKQRFDDAIAAYEKGRALMHELGNRRFEAVAIGNLGYLYTRRGELERAEPLIEQALAMQKELGYTSGLPAVYHALGDLRLRQDRVDEAYAAFEQAASIASSSRSAFQEVGALARMAGLLVNQKKPDEALATAERALAASETMLGGLADAEGALVRQQLDRLFGIGLIAAVDAENVDAAIRFLERGRAGGLLDALDQRDAIRWSRSSLPEALLQMEQAARETEAAALEAYQRARRRGELPAMRRTARVLEQASEQQREVSARIQRAVKQEDGALYLPRRRTRLDLQGSLEAHEALVLYGVGGPRAVAVVVREDATRLVDLGDTEAVLKACEALDLATQDGDSEPARIAAHKALVEPLGLGEDVTQVILSPDGVLAYVPFSVLFSRTVALTPSGTAHVILREEAYAPGEGILSLGDPVYTAKGSSPRRSPRGAALAALPATRAEAEGVGTTVLLGPKASESGLRAALPKDGRLRAVHFACHGLVDELRPALSSLALSEDETSDGFLTALEIRRMDIPADLAVLSACETGRGRIIGGEGLVGMSRAFMFAGAPRVICSLWKVDDEATQALMLEFYRLWSPKDGSAGLPAAEALRKAQTHVRAQPRWKHPYYWAAWVLWGLPE